MRKLLIENSDDDAIHIDNIERKHIISALEKGIPIGVIVNAGGLWSVFIAGKDSAAYTRISDCISFIKESCSNEIEFHVLN